MTDTRIRPPDVQELVCVGKWQARFGPHGVLVSPAAWSPAPQPRGAIRVLPEPCDDLLGRQYETQSVLAAMRGGSPVNVWGECGIGKTSLLRQVSHWAAAEFDGLPIVFATAASKPLEDLLHEIHGCLFASPVPAKWRPDHVRAQLRTAQAVVVIDDVALTDADLAELLWALGDALVVIASPVPRTDPGLQPIALDGLDAQSAAELFQRGLGGYHFSPGEREEIGRLTGPGLLRGHPLQVQQAAALVQSGHCTITELVRSLQFGEPTDRLAQECLSALNHDERQIAAVLALAAGTYLPTDLVAHMTPTEAVLDHLYVMRQRHVIDSRWDWVGLPVCSVGEPYRLIAPSLDLRFALGGLVNWLEQPDLSPDELVSVSGCVLAILQFAREAGEWDSVLDIVLAIEPALFLCGRWDQWRSVLRTGAEAAAEVGSSGFRAYCLHQLGTRALCLGDDAEATRLLTQAASLRPRRHAREARSVTTHNLDQITPHREWRHSIAITTAAAVVLAAGGLAGVAHFFHPDKSFLLVPPASPAGPAGSAPGNITLPSGSLSPSQTPHSATPSRSAAPGVSVSPTGFPGVVTSPVSVSPTPHTGNQRVVTTVNAVSPNSGPEAGGTTVTVTGRGFTDAVAVDFGGISASSMTVVSDTKVTAKSPSGAGTVNVTVVTTSGASSTNQADKFTYIGAPPTVTSVSPASGPQSGGTFVTIIGTGFADTEGVNFGGVAASAVTIVSNNKITAFSPAGSGTVNVRVVTTNGTSRVTSADQFTYGAG
jgi:IPT/TIG domain